MRGGKDCGCGAGGAKAPDPRLCARDDRLRFPVRGAPDSLLQSVLPEPSIAAQGIEFSEHLLRFFDQNPFEAEAVTWTLNLDATPVYAILPAGAYAAALTTACASYCVASAWRRNRAQGRPAKDGVDLVSLPGHIVGTVRLLSGQVVPAVVPAVRDVHSWSISALLGSCSAATRCQARPGGLRFSGERPWRLPQPHLLRPQEPRRHPGGQGAELCRHDAFQARQVVEAATVQGPDLERSRSTRVRSAGRTRTATTSR